MCFFKPKVAELAPPISTKRITNAELYNVLQAVAVDGALYLSDGDYLLCHNEDIKRFLAQDATNRIKYVADQFDCDDFSYRLMGQFSVPDWSDLSIGIVWTDLHALNCLVDENRKFWFLEPQTDELVDKLPAWAGTRIRFIMI